MRALLGLLAMLAAGGAWWGARAQGQPGAPVRGGTLRLLASSAAGSIDPQINYTAQYWQVFAAVYDGLVAFRKADGKAGLEVVPDLAEALPEVEGLRYRFRLRRGVRFSDGREVTAEDVAASFRRIYRVGGPTGQSFFGAIDGAEACLAAPAECTLPGVRAEGRDVVITLVRPDPELLQKLALPHASILPADAPGQDAGSVPVTGTGPYRIAEYDANRAMVLERNPYFHVWSAAAQPDGWVDRVDYQFGLDAGAQVTAVLAGEADWMFDVPPPDRLGEVAAHPAQLHINPAFALLFVPLNVNIPPFDDIRVRQAFSMAVDRAAAVRLLGGPRMAVALCQVLPPGLPGYAPFCPYAHDMAQARGLVRESGHEGAAVTLVTDDGATSRALGTWLVDVMGQMGLRGRLQSLSANVQFGYIQNTRNRVQASLTSWYADYPSAANILVGNFGCAAFRPGSDSSTNIPGFCDKALDARLEAALLAHDTDGIAEVDRAITRAAPAVVLASPRFIDVLAPRVRGYVYNDTFRWLFQLAWVQ